MGSRAPDFELPDQHGAAVRLSDFRGAGPILVVFYPFAFTGVCTRELHDLHDALPRLAPDSRVLAVSCDTMFTLRVFGEREGLDLQLLSDFWPHGAVASAYGVFDAERGCAGRGTFAIDAAGVIRWSVFRAIPDPRDIEDYVRVVRELAAR